MPHNAVCLATTASVLYRLSRCVYITCQLRDHTTRSARLLPYLWGFTFNARLRITLGSSEHFLRTSRHRVTAYVVGFLKDAGLIKISLSSPRHANDSYDRRVRFAGILRSTKIIFLRLVFCATETYASRGVVSVAVAGKPLP